MKPIIELSSIFVEHQLNARVCGVTHDKRQNVIRTLSDISFAVNDGDVVGIIGKNGAGKSTLLRVVSGLQPIKSGKIYLDAPVSYLGNKNAGLLAKATCLQNIKLKGCFYGFTGKHLREYIRSVVQNFNVDIHLHTEVNKLSSGTKSKLVLSMISNQKDKILVLDEWIGTLDRKNSIRSGGELKKIIKESKCVLFASHHEKIIRKYCNKVLVLQNGCMEYYGNVDDGFSKYHLLR